MNGVRLNYTTHVSHQKGCEMRDMKSLYAGKDLLSETKRTIEREWNYGGAVRSRIRGNDETSINFFKDNSYVRFFFHWGNQKNRDDMHVGVFASGTAEELEVMVKGFNLPFDSAMILEADEDDGFPIM
ncbi:MAG: hypothetical protein ABIE22_05545 [archaeon]